MKLLLTTQVGLSVALVREYQQMRMTQLARAEQERQVTMLELLLVSISQASLRLLQQLVFLGVRNLLLSEFVLNLE